MELLSWPFYFRVGEGHVPGQLVTLHHSHSPSRASTPNPSSGTWHRTPQTLTGCLMQPAPLSAPSPGSNSPFKLEPAAIPLLNWNQSILTLCKLSSTLIFLESPQGTCPSPRRQLQMSPRAFPLPFPPPIVFKSSQTVN